MDAIIKFGILYVLNGVAFIIQDFRIDSKDEKPSHVLDPSPKTLINAILIIPFMTLIKPLMLRNTGIFIIQIIYTVGIYYYVYTEFSIGFLVAFVLSLTILRGVLRNFTR